MKLKLYKEISSILEGIKFDSMSSLDSILKQFDVSKNTILAIYSQHIQRKLKKLSYICNEEQVKQDFVCQYKSKVATDEKVICSLAAELGLPPVLLGRIILEHVQGENPSSSLLKDPLSITNPILRNQIIFCLENDYFCGPNIDMIKKMMGEEYEYVLKDQLTLMNISFKDENILREQGYDKTPDFLLTVPIAVDGVVINWIESKASFGDEYTHKQYLREQYWSYWNRFGSGLIIYWFGFIDELENDIKDRGLLLRSDMPRDVLTLTWIYFPEAKLKSNKSYISINT